MRILALTSWLAAGLCAFAQIQPPPQQAESPATDSASPSPDSVLPVWPAPVAVPLNEERILKVIPDYQTVEDSSKPIAPMTVRQKFDLAWRETIDPFNIGSAAMTAAFSQLDNQTPKYGKNWSNYSARFGAAVADFGTQNFFSAGIFASAFHQDPRYFRKGPSARLLPRVWYSVTRTVVCRDDSGRSVLNTSNLAGMSLGIAASNVYYPSASRTGTIMAGRIETSMFGGVMGNLMSEFWPDIRKKLFQKKFKK